MSIELHQNLYVEIAAAHTRPAAEIISFFITKLFLGLKKTIHLSNYNNNHNKNNVQILRQRNIII